jgi:hypothetical protein
VPLKILAERTERGETTLAHFHTMQLDCKRDWIPLRDSGNAIAGALLRFFEQRFTATGDSLQTS